MENSDVEYAIKYVTLYEELLNELMNKMSGVFFLDRCNNTFFIVKNNPKRSSDVWFRFQMFYDEEKDCIDIEAYHGKEGMFFISWEDFYDNFDQLYGENNSQTCILNVFKSSIDQDFVDKCINVHIGESTSEVSEDDINLLISKIDDTLRESFERILNTKYSFVTESGTQLGLTSERKREEEGLLYLCVNAECCKQTFRNNLVENIQRYVEAYANN